MLQSRCAAFFMAADTSYNGCVMLFCIYSLGTNSAPTLFWLLSSLEPADHSEALMALETCPIAELAPQLGLG